MPRTQQEDLHRISFVLTAPYRSTINEQTVSLFCTYVAVTNTLLNASGLVLTIRLLQEHWSGYFMEEVPS